MMSRLVRLFASPLQDPGETPGATPSPWVVESSALATIRRRGNAHEDSRARTAPPTQPREHGVRRSQRAPIQRHSPAYANCGAGRAIEMQVSRRAAQFAMPVLTLLVLPPQEA